MASQKERDELLKDGFDSWSKRDFQQVYQQQQQCQFSSCAQFVKACERWGRDDIDHIKLDVRLT